ncbi:hypothetical protein ABZ601_31450 [Streptomyces sp. NPDC012842]|uniref:hypothetical protein n=1 Tax=Streptomyces TaxID=1883 RepID=UPI0033F015C1
MASLKDTWPSRKLTTEKDTASWENVARSKDTMAPENSVRAKVTVLLAENAIEGHPAAGERGVGKGHDAAGEHRAAGVRAAVDGDTGEVEVAALPGTLGFLRPTVVGADEAQDRVPHLTKGQVAVVLLLASGVVAGVGGEGKLKVGAQDVDAGLAQVVVGGVVGETGQCVNATEPDGRGVRAEFVDSLGKAFAVEPVGAGLVDALAAVGDDQGDERRRVPASWAVSRRSRSASSGRLPSTCSRRG